MRVKRWKFISFLYAIKDEPELKTNEEFEQQPTQPTPFGPGREGRDIHGYTSNTVQRSCRVSTGS
jgi:hypothetical protein